MKSLGTDSRMCNYLLVMLCSLISIEGEGLGQNRHSRKAASTFTALVHTELLINQTGKVSAGTKLLYELCSSLIKKYFFDIINNYYWRDHN